MRLISGVFLFLCYFYSNGLCVSSESSQVKTDLQKDLEQIMLTKKRSKIVACMSLVRNSLAEGNNEMKLALDESNFDRSKSFDKIVLSMISYCESNIKDGEMEHLLNPDNILSSVDNNKNFINLIKFDKNILKSSSELIFSEAEHSILKEISDSSQILDTDMTFQEEEIGFMGFKLSQIGKGSYIIFVSIALFLVVVVVFGGLYALKCKKKTTKKKDKKH